MVGVAGRARAGPRVHRAAPAVAVPDRVDGSVRIEDGVEHPAQAAVALGDHGFGAAQGEAVAEVVDTLLGRVQRRPGLALLAVARGIAEVVQQDDGVGRQAQLGHVFLAVVLDVGVTVPGRLVQPHPSGRCSWSARHQRAAVRVGVAVAVAHVDEDVCPASRGLDRRPRGVGRVDLRDTDVAAGPDAVEAIRVAAVAGRVLVGCAHDDHDLGLMDGGRDRAGLDPNGGGLEPLRPAWAGVAATGSSRRRRGRSGRCRSMRRKRSGRCRRRSRGRSRHWPGHPWQGS